VATPLHPTALVSGCDRASPGQVRSPPRGRSRSDFEANAFGTFNALEAAVFGRDPIFIYAST